MSTVDIIGWFAGSLVLAAFYVKTMLPLRCVAIASNIAFIGYGLLADALPILVLHTLLLPMNLLRLYQLWYLNQRIACTKCAELPFRLLTPYLDIYHLTDGQTLFEKGDHAAAMFLLLHGQVHIVEDDAYVQPGELVGAMDIFAPQQRRTDTAVCRGEVELAAISDGKIWELFYQNPQFGAYLMRLVVFNRTRDKKDLEGLPQSHKAMRATARSGNTTTLLVDPLIAVSLAPIFNWRNPS